MTGPNGTVIAWMRRIDERLEGIEQRIVDRSVHQKLEDRVEEMESKTERLAIKQAGIAASMSMVAVWIKSTFFGH